ncbi:acyl-CoA dehydrogenase [Frigidibacter albus]|uniref:Acyl-CoA dehydrogenase n=1 Tax=Frigidibacter albus TaxID=1465486 RepID=A0A6L8VLX8_9RHOB|nr:acyl-CoA dehydrogenase family protein [Frigidibacter albus]MZQ91074.1 acyl-CoA dehydrogenase [Frigidibacter albus]NBE32959.1 acyl-CoA dehydrogenase [Frigidibacter albus]GGH62665.1 acyl-CoA dehydrogenase [Frigidibacter albus]
MQGQTQEDHQFREEVRDWLAANVPRDRRPAEAEAMRAYDMAWQRRQWDGGWAGIGWPAEMGGRPLSLTQRFIWYEEYGRIGAPRPGAGFIGLTHAGPTLIAKGTDEQRDHHLKPILRGEHVWCQGFSEPGAGSDLAGLSTKGEIDGDHIVVNGSKIWTSYAHVADYQELLVRTGGGEKRHDGISWVICDMRSPGIEVRPIRTMSGEMHFNQVFYDNMRIPLKNVVGGLNNGWKVAMATLGFERGTGFVIAQIELEREVEQLIALAREGTDRRGRRLIENEAVRAGLATMRAEVRALHAMSNAMMAETARDGVPGAEGSIIRLFSAELNQRIYRFAQELMGPGLVAPDAEAEHWGLGYLNSFRHTIAGGTSQIQRNLIGERVLGLPRG